VKRIVWVLYAVVVIFNFLDAWQTILLIEVGATEANPVVAYLINLAGTTRVLWLIKSCTCLFLGVALYLYQHVSKEKCIQISSKT
jgi:hypothetical protein